MRRHAPSGFTLIELTVAVVVSAVGLVFILGGMQNTIAVLSSAEKTSAANYLLAGKIWENGQLDGDAGPKEGETSGQFESPYEAHQWTRVIEEIPDDLFADKNETALVKPHLWKETTTVSWTGQGGIRGRNLSLIRYLHRS